MASDIFSGLADLGLALFGNQGELVKEWLSKDLLKQGDATTAELPAYRAGLDSDLNRILAAISGAQPEVKKVGDEDLSSLGQLLQQNVQTRPLDTAMTYGNYSTGLLDKVAKNIAGYGKSQDNRLLASLGHGGGGGSTFQTNTILDRVSKNLAPAYSSIIAGIPGAVSTFSQGDASRANNAINLVAQRAGIPLRGIQTEMLGSGQRAQTMSDKIGALTGLSQAYRSNYLGSRYVPSKGERIASGAGNALDGILDAYVAYQTGGLSTMMDKGGKKTGDPLGFQNYTPTSYQGVAPNFQDYQPT
jgi:hypothetical protein